MVDTPDSVAAPAPSEAETSIKDLNREIQLRAISTRLIETEKDLDEAKKLVSHKNAQITKLETENVRLKMQRTDRELAVQVDALRSEVGKKDRENVELRRRIEALQENEAIILRRAASAEQKVVLMQGTMETFQKSRDKAHLDVEKHDRERLDAVRQMVDAQDRAKKAETKLAELEGRGKAVKPIAKDDNALKTKKQ